jgi:hypothetical protein
MDPTYFPKAICDQQSVRLGASFRPLCPATNGLKVWVRSAHFLPTPGSFVARRESGSVCPSTATRDNGPRTKKSIPPLPIMCTAYTVARSFDDFRKDAIGTIDAIERTGRFPNNVALSTTGLSMARPKLAVAGFNRSPRDSGSLGSAKAILWA